MEQKAREHFWRPRIPVGTQYATLYESMGEETLWRKE